MTSEKCILVISCHLAWEGRGNPSGWKKVKPWCLDGAKVDLHEAVQKHSLHCANDLLSPSLACCHCL